MNKVELDKSVNHHIALSAMMIKRVFYKILNENKLNITPEQWSILYYLSEIASLTVSELAELTFKDFANISRITHKLEVAGLIKNIRTLPINEFQNSLLQILVKNLSIKSINVHINQPILLCKKLNLKKGKLY